jgi:hypothetical protein
VFISTFQDTYSVFCSINIKARMDKRLLILSSIANIPNYSAHLLPLQLFPTIMGRWDSNIE